jgi:hypothetical protein
MKKKRTQQLNFFHVYSLLEGKTENDAALTKH